MQNHKNRNDFLGSNASMRKDLPKATDMRYMNFSCNLLPDIATEVEVDD